MAAFSTIVATAAAGIGAVGTVVGAVQQRKASKEGAEAQQAQQRLAERRSRRQAIRRSQIQRATATASAQSAGALGSSGPAGGINSVSSRLGESLSFGTQMSGLSQQITQARADAQRGASIAKLGGAAFNFGASRGGLDFLDDIEFGGANG